MARNDAKKVDRKAKKLALEVVEGVFDDPDFGRELTAYAKKRLRAASNTRRKTVSLAEIKERYG